MKTQITLLLFGIFLLSPIVSNAQLLEVKQTVFGMDCSPCAHGLEKRIKKMDGIKSASVSLNDGLLTATLIKDNTLTLKKIRSAVENSGFKAQEADIIVKGFVINEDNYFVLKSESGEQFELIFGDQTSLINYSERNQIVVVSGEAKVSEEMVTKLLVKMIDKP